MSTNRQILDMEGRNTRIPKLGVIVAPILVGLVILMVLHWSSQSRNIVSPIEILLGTPAGPSSDVVAVTRDDITIYMAPNATDVDGSISIAVAAPNLSMLVDEAEWIIPKVVRVEFLSPAGASIPGVSFSPPLEVCFKLTEEQWQAYTQHPESFRIQHYADHKNPPRWEILPQVTYPDRFQLCGQASELSMFGLAIRVEAGVPVTGLTTALAPGAVGAVIPPAETRERQERNNAQEASAPEMIPTNPLPTSIPPTQLPPTTVLPVQPPAIQPQPTDAPPAESPTKEEKQKEEEKKQEEKQKEEEKKQEEKQKEEEKKQEEKQKEEEKKQEEKQKEEEKKQEEKQKKEQEKKN